MTRATSMLGRAGLAALVSLTGPAFAAPVAATVAHAPHRAFYEVTIGRAEPGASVVDAHGAFVVEWERACEGWISRQRFAVSMERADGDPIESEIVMSTFERHDGTRYQFDGATRIGGEIIEEVRGTAERPGPGEPGVAVYRTPRDTRIELPADTLFPFEHTIVLIEAAESGEGRAFGHYFDGQQPEISPMPMNALILGEAHDPAEGGFDRLDEIARHKWWRVRLAWFARGASEQPEFEMAQDLQDNGVVRAFEFDYGEFSILATLARVEAIAAPSCP